MTGTAFPTTGGYNAAPINPVTNAPLVDSNDSQVPNGSAPNLAQTPPISQGGYDSQSIQVLSAILVELRVISNLLNRNMENTDLASLRSDEAPGATGGAIN